MKTVNDLNDGDVFSLDGGMTWYVCAVVLFGNVAVYATTQRGDESPTVRIDAEREAPVIVQSAEPWCNHDAVAVVNGVCECGVRLI